MYVEKCDQISSSSSVIVLL